MNTKAYKLITLCEAFREVDGKDFFKNPTKKELQAIGRKIKAMYLIPDRDLWVWSPKTASHAEAHKAVAGDLEYIPDRTKLSADNRRDSAVIFLNLTLVGGTTLHVDSIKPRWSQISDTVVKAMARKGIKKAAVGKVQMVGAKGFKKGDTKKLKELKIKKVLGKEDKTFVIDVPGVGIVRAKTQGRKVTDIKFAGGVDDEKIVTFKIKKFIKQLDPDKF